MTLCPTTANKRRACAPRQDHCVVRLVSMSYPVSCSVGNPPEMMDILPDCDSILTTTKKGKGGPSKKKLITPSKYLCPLHASTHKNLFPVL